MKSRTLRLACLLLGLVWAVSAQAQYRLTPTGSGPPTGGELQIGTGLPLPVGPAGIFQGGKNLSTAGTAFWPPLLIGPKPAAVLGGGSGITIMQTGATDPMTIKITQPVLSRSANGTPSPIAVFTTNPAVFQVATTIDYAWPKAAATFAPGGGPGPAVFSTTGSGAPLPSGGSLQYFGSANSFGGPAQFAIAPGPGAAGGRVPPNSASVNPIASVWINFAGGLPATVMAAVVVGASNPIGAGQPGASVASPTGTTAFGPLAPADGPFGAVNVTTPVVCCAVGSMGTIASSIPLATVMVPFPPYTLPGQANMVTGSKGFPWTTALLSVYAPGTVGGNPMETFFLSGTDMRVAGVGNISMVSGAVSDRNLSGPNANRGWISLNLVLPEPGMVLGTVGALAMLGICHGLVRRRSR